MSVSLSLAGRVALVTGAARRVGRAIALELAAAGCDVGLHCRSSRADAERLAEDIQRMGRRSAVLVADLAIPEQRRSVVERTIRHFGRLDILVNNAAVFHTEARDDLDSFTEESWEAVLRVNTLAPVDLCRLAAPHLAATGAGRIVNLCDIAADRPWPSHLAYCVSKAGLACATKALARALAPETLVNGISPGVAVFPESYDDEIKARLTARIPLGHAGTPEQIAHLCRFLVETDYVTGQIIAVDGGRSLA